jgi:putative intracellular protease/amidase
VSGKKTAIITGASGGIGAGLVAGFLEEGYNVVATSRHTNQKLTASGSLVRIDGDIGKQQTAADAVEAAIKNFGTAHIRRTDSISKRRTTMTTKGKVLVLVSSGHGLPLKDGKVYTGAGYYLNELTVPVRALMNEGYEITFANPKGNTPQMDVHSAVADFFGGDEARLQDYLKFRDTLTGLKNPTRISDVIASGLDRYDAVFVPGGHGPMMDLLDDPDAGTVLRHFHKTSKPTAVLCHGPISLLSALPNSKEFVAALSAGDTAGAHAKAQGWIYSGYKMTIFSTAEEQQREPLEIGGKVLFYPDFALRTAGGDVSVAAPWQSYVLQDRELISGQNPFSDEALLKLLLPALSEKKKVVSAA